MVIRLSLTVFEIWAFEFWPQIRAKREIPPSSPCPEAKHYIYECPSGTSFSFVSRRRWVKSPSRVTVRKLWSSISRVRSFVETRSQQQISAQKSRESFGIDEFVVRLEILFVKVKGPHFRRPKCLDSVALDILNVRRDLHRSAKDFAISFENSTSFESRKL